MQIETVRFSHILEENRLRDITYFLAHTAFVVSHKTESTETLLKVLWYLPVESSIIVVTNCPEQEREEIEISIKEHLTFHRNIYVIHQKDERVARFFQAHGVEHILGNDGKVLNGKGEGMYIGTLAAILLRYPRWIVYYDADNLVPCALLEYTLALGRLFLSAHVPYPFCDSDVSAPLHNIRICWSSKPFMKNGTMENNLLGRCTRVISPVFGDLLEEWFGLLNYRIVSSNAGEQAMTIKTAQALRFSAGFSVETLQLLDLFYKATERRGHQSGVLLQQYQSQSPHFHTKKEDEHIRQMIAVSLGSFLVFQGYLPPRIESHVLRICDELSLDVASPLVYPPLQSLDLEGDEAFVRQYRLFEDTEHRETLLEITTI
jgi:mannosyl-3-phosphoglycerate synthase